jgi:hypothetical protein
MLLRAARPLTRRCFSNLSRHGTVLGGERITPQNRATFEAWHDLVGAVAAGRAADVELRRIVADECVFRPPTYFKPWTGGDETTVLLACAAEVFGDSFRYHRQWLSPDGREWALEFAANVGDSGRGIDGIDLVSLDDAGKIRDFTVLARPPNGVAALKDIMMKKVPPKLLAFKAKRALGF